MHKLAIISDVHGNLHALEAVLKDLDTVAPDEIVVAGDLVGRGPQSKEVLDLIMATHWPTIIGNHEMYWVDCHRGNTPDNWDNGWWAPTRNEIDRLDPLHFKWMATLPHEYISTVENTPAVQIVHGSPRKLTEGLYTNDPDDVIYTAVSESPHGIVVGAHTHVPMQRRVRDKWLLNCGSVGAPFNQDPAAQYLVLTLQGTQSSAEFRRVPYDHQAALRYWRNSGYLDNGVAARIFALELESATFHFWHYVRFCQVMALPLDTQNSLDRYREEFPAYEQFCRTHALKLSDTVSLEFYRDRIENPV